MNRYLIFLLVFLTYSAAVVFVIPRSMVENAVEQGMKARAQLYRPVTAAQLIEQTDELHRRVITGSGFSDLVHTMFIPDREGREKSGVLADLGGGMFSWLEYRFSLMSLFCYEVLARWNEIMLWYPQLLCVGFMSAAGGWLRRKIKQTNFEISSAAREKYALTGMLAVLVLMAVWLTVPLHLGIGVLTVLWTVECVLAGIVTANLQKRI
ncbi:MAG: DUF4400 domain-containing protein [Succinivibrionaceae bacterium]|nr:DUF4400 domain-containing protein [Succinivibrionaceae bacterium]